ncbi:hypothetical protein AB0O75_12760 [Streptomyces sp. NPDC088921]|uniref:hypothetical protein n=1 Tax=unclassified Streptomyces TaxID=2593676 RepID=UPI0034430B87
MTSHRPPVAARTSTVADTSQANQARAATKELPVPPTVPQDGVRTRPAGCLSADWGGLGSPGPTKGAKYAFPGITYARPPASPSCWGTTPRPPTR